MEQIGSSHHSSRVLNDFKGTLLGEGGGKEGGQGEKEKNRDQDKDTNKDKEKDEMGFSDEGSVYLVGGLGENFRRT